MTDEPKMLGPDEIRGELLDTLIKFDEFCSREGLRYSLAGGTLLGAVRHGGFIPWDDDIDLSMPRPDYEKLVVFAKEGLLPEGLSGIPHSGIWEHPVLMKVINETVAVDTRFEDGTGRLWLDVLPIDGLPTEQGLLESIYSRCGRYRRVVGLCMANPHEGKSGLKRLLKPIAVPVVNCLGLLSWASGRLEYLASKIAYESTSWCGAVTWGLYGAGERYPISGWDKMVEVEFEGKKFPSIGCWDEYLHGIYGNYMQLPPVEKRVNHEIKAWRVG